MTDSEIMYIVIAQSPEAQTIILPEFIDTNILIVYIWFIL